MNKQLRYEEQATMDEQRKEDNMGGRRAEDVRIKNVEDDIKEIKSDNKDMQGDITYIKTRIDNGFSTSIKSTENKVEYIDTENTRAHGELRNDIKDLSKKFDKILWFFGIGIFSVIISVIIKSLL